MSDLSRLNYQEEARRINENKRLWELLEERVKNGKEDTPYSKSLKTRIENNDEWIDNFEDIECDILCGNFDDGY